MSKLYSKVHQNNISGCLGTILLGGVLSAIAPNLATAQAIIPANDGTGTRVNTQGNLVDITGGSFSRDGANLFHSFQQLNVPAGTAANFITTPNVQNILGRVVGGNPSLINGLIQVTGSNSNLYIINPAGIIFGQGASLNVPASFTATTANQIGFGNNNWFTSFGNNNYQNLTGTPNQFLFNTPLAGSIVNTGNLVLTPGQNLTLLGGAVLNTGNLVSPGGNITVTAVPGTNLVRLSQPGNILSLEVVPPENGIITPLSLPQLLTGNSNITGVTLNPDGTLPLGGFDTPLDRGNVVMTGRINAVNRNIINLPTIPRVQILGDRIALFNTVINASGINGGGTVLVGGEYLGQGIIPTAQFTFADTNTRIRANGIGNANGGRVIAWANNTTRFFGSINARGGNTGGNGGFIETSGKLSLDVSGIRINASSAFGSPGLWLLDPTDVNIVAGVGIPTGGAFAGGVFTPDGVTSPATIFDTTITALLGLGTSVTIQTNPGLAGGNGDINVNTPLNASPPITGATLTLLGSRDININATINGGINGPLNIALNTPGDIRINSFIRTNGGNFTANAGNSFINLANLDTTSTITAISGNIIIRANNGLISAQNFDSSTTLIGGVAGSVTLDAPISILVGTINSSANAFGNGGAIDVTTGGLFRSNNTLTGPIVCSAFSLCSNGGITSGNIIIRHGGGVNNPFFVGVAGQDNGTLGGIVSDIPFTIGPITFPPEDTIIGRTRIRTTVPPPTIPPEFFIFLRNPEPPPTPPPVVVGTPPTPERPPATPPPSPPATPPPSPPVIPPSPPATPPPSPPVIPPSPPVIPPSPPVTPPGLTVEQQNRVARDFQQREQPLPILRDIPPMMLDTIVSQLDRSFTNDFEDFLGVKASQDLSLEDIQRSLKAINLETGTKPAIIYVFFSKPSSTTAKSDETRGTDLGRAAVERSSLFPSPDDQLEMLVVFETGVPIRKTVGATRREVVALANRFRTEITAYRTSPRGYVASSQQLYKWLIAPLENELKEKEIDNLNFILDQGLRSLPIAALNDGQGFLMEKYSLAMLPSLALTDMRYRNIKTASILAMGATTFRDQNPLPAVGLELAETTKGRGENYFLNEEFTLANLRQQHQQQGRKILHLATHGVFQGNLDSSYIQLWDRRLTLRELPELGLNQPLIDLLVLSACQTALGNREAELGFAGLAVQAGVRSSMASLWEVSDEATLGLMTNFYDQLTTAPIKAEAVRRSQLAMLRRQVRLEGGNLVSEMRSTPLTRELAALGDRNFSHPYFWSAFTLVGNPW